MPIGIVEDRNGNMVLVRHWATNKLVMLRLKNNDGLVIKNCWIFSTSIHQCDIEKITSIDSTKLKYEIMDR
jgi:hypothetical protein